ncbi:MAG: type III-B CRISPR module-associated protein Cmr5 [Moorella sp. (in: Bacteria)]|nr:type III-B CRISPR module-associated protein Cmr5 [Moorella sp. (in: firmicutes)]
MMRTLEQERAAHALEKVRAVQKTFSGDGEKADKFASYVESLPATILANGLGQAAATLLAQAKGVQSDPHYKLYCFLEEWLCRDAAQAPYRQANDLMEAIVNNDRQAYLHAQAEALAWLEWLKKFAVAFLKKKTEK